MSQQFGINDVVKFRVGKGIAYGKIISQNGEKFVVENLRTQKTQNKGWDTLTLSSMDEFQSTTKAVKPTTEKKSRKSATVNKGKVWGSKFKVGETHFINGNCITILSFSKYHGLFIVKIGNKTLPMDESQLIKLTTVKVK